ncbi:MAG: hypothetical protein LBQ60_16870, partial [Bacteroidales bacterium]|nr:hypothetical protein [Bacteroidales bacterium]
MAIKTYYTHIFWLICCGILLCNSFLFAQTGRSENQLTPLEYRFPQPDPNPYFYPSSGGGLFLKTPPNVKYEAEYDPVQDRYVFRQKVGDLNNSVPYSMNRSDFLNQKMTEQKKLNWEGHSKGSIHGESTGGTGFIPQFTFGGEAFDRIFGTNVISIVPQGSAELIFGLNTTRTENPNLSESARKNTTFDFDTRLQVNVTGS